MGCGNLHFPTSFMELPAQSAGLSSGAQQPLPWNYDLVDEIMIENVWKTISKQPEFQHYYNKTDKKVAVFLYMPSMGTGNPADWDFFIFVEKNE